MKVYGIKRALKADLKRGIFSWGFYASIGLTIVSLLIPTLTWEEFSTDSLYSYYALSFQEVFRYMAPIIGVLPFNGIFYDESKSGFIRFAVMRTSRRTYISSKIISSMVCSFCSMFLGAVIFGIYVGLMRAAVQTEGLVLTGLQGQQTVAGGYPPAIAASAAFLGIFSATWGLCGLAVSALVESKFFSFVLPFMIFHLMGYVSREMWLFSDKAGAIFYKMTPGFLALPDFGMMENRLWALGMNGFYSAAFMLLFAHFVKGRGIYDV